MQLHERLESGASHIEITLTTNESRPRVERRLLLVHGLPRALGMGRTAAGMLPELAEHLANESGWTVATITMSGVGNATGTFSAPQWVADLTRAVDFLFQPDEPLALAGFGLGGNIALSVASGDERIRGVATFATSADLLEWCGEPTKFRSQVLRAGVVDPVQTLPEADVLVEGLIALDPLRAIAAIPPRRLLIGHGAEDRDVPVFHARRLHAAAQEHAELRIIQGAGHWLRADPRMVATLLGWMDRH